jgi:uncharacterized membrane protein (GlpM family)
MDLKLVPLYFIVGGTIVTLVTYFGSHSRGTLAAFVALFPSITVITLCTVYWRGGSEDALSYAKSLIYLLPAWLLYIGAVVYLMPRIGLWPPLVIGVALCIAATYLTMRIMHLK